MEKLEFFFRLPINDLGTLKCIHAVVREKLNRTEKCMLMISRNVNQYFFVELNQYFYVYFVQHIFLYRCGFNGYIINKN